MNQITNLSCDYLRNSKISNVTNKTSMTTSNASAAPSFDWISYLALVVCSLGVLTNLINISVFINRKLKNTCYTYMLMKSLAACFFLFSTIIDHFIVYCPNCSIRYSYLANLYAFIVTYYMSASLTIFRVLIEIILSIRTLLILFNSDLKSPSKITSLVLFVVSLGLYANRPFKYNISYYDPCQQYFGLTLTTFGASTGFRVISIVQQALRAVLVVIGLTVINVISWFKFKKKFFKLKVWAFEMSAVRNSKHFTISGILDDFI